MTRRFNTILGTMLSTYKHHWGGGKERGEGRNRVRGEDGYRGYKGRGLL